MQLITHIPLFSVRFPANAMSFYKMIKKSTTFDFSDSIDEDLNQNEEDFENEISFNDRCDLLDIF